MDPLSEHCTTNLHERSLIKCLSSDHRPSRAGWLLGRLARWSLARPLLRERSWGLVVYTLGRLRGFLDLLCTTGPAVYPYHNFIAIQSHGTTLPFLSTNLWTMKLPPILYGIYPSAYLYILSRPTPSDDLIVYPEHVVLMAKTYMNLHNVFMDLIYIL